MKMKEGRIKDFDLLKVLGKGAYGKVNIAQQKLTGKLCAVKSINMNNAV